MTTPTTPLVSGLAVLSLTRLVSALAAPTTPLVSARIALSLTRLVSGLAVLSLHHALCRAWIAPMTLTRPVSGPDCPVIDPPCVGPGCPDDTTPCVGPDCPVIDPSCVGPGCPVIDHGCANPPCDDDDVCLNPPCDDDEDGGCEEPLLDPAGIVWTAVEVKSHVWRRSL